MKKIILSIFFLLNIIAVCGAAENSLFIVSNNQNNLSLELLTGILAFGVFGLFSIELYKNRKNKI